MCPGSRRTDLNSPNRRVRTRMPGGVGGEGPGSPVLPYPDCPAWMVTWGWESPGELVVATQVNRKAATVRGPLKEAASEPAS